MTERDHDNEVEGVLRRYRPAGPPETLRSRVLSSARSRRGRGASRSWEVWVFRAAVAAAVVLAAGLGILRSGLLLACVLATPSKGF